MARRNWNWFLGELFTLRHLQPSSSQDELIITKCINLLLVVCQEYITDKSITTHKDTKCVDKFNPQDLSCIINTLQSLLLPFTKGGPRWYPEYGCVLVSERIGIGACRCYRLIGLDNWQLLVYRQEKSVAYTSKPFGLVEFEIGVIHDEDRVNFLQHFQDALRIAKSRRGGARTAAHGEQGHQKTPSFIECLIRQALDKIHDRQHVDYQPTPFGGTTDVGRHCGNNPRSTSWPLVYAALQSLVHNPFLFDKLMLNVKLIVTEVELLETYPLTIHVDCIFTMMQQIVLDYEEMECNGYEANGLVIRVGMIRRKLEEYVWMQSNNLCKQFRISPILHDPEYCFSKVVSPVLNPRIPSIAQNCMDNIRQRAIVNVMLIPAALLTFSFQDTWKWMQCVTRFESYSAATLLVLSHIDQFMFNHVDQLTEALGPKLSIEEINSIDSIVIEYGKILDDWLLHRPDSKYQFVVVLRSKQVLVTWIAFCLVHYQCSINYPLVKQFSIPLSWSELRNLVIDDMNANESVCKIVAYIHKVNQQTRIPLWSLSDQAGTLKFAETFAKSDTVMLGRWREEKQMVLMRQDAWMKKVREKQAQLVELRRHLVVLKKAYIQAKCATKVAEDKYNSEEASCHIAFNSRRQDLSIAKRVERNARSEVTVWEQEMHKTLLPPDYIVNPLPEDESAALAILFFLLMPEDLNKMSCLCLASQETLVPRPPFPAHGKIREMLATELDQNTKSWRKHYNNYSNQFAKADIHVALYNTTLNPPSQYGPQSVDDIRWASQGAWFPFGGRNILVPNTKRNPFNVNPSDIRCYFIEQLPAEHASLQWTLEYPTGILLSPRNHRGNMAYANQSQKPLDRFNKEGFLDLCSLRSFPNQQVRKLIKILQKRILPLSHIVVKNLVRQSLYQIGNISIHNDQVIQDWRTDVLKYGGLHALEQQGCMYETQLRHTPRDHEAIELISEICAFFSQISKKRTLPRQFCSISISWAQILQEQITSNMCATSNAQLRAKQCVFFGYAILAQSSYGEFNESDAATILQLIVRFHHGLVYAIDSSDCNLRQMNVLVQSVMSHRVNELVKFIDCSSGSMLTDAVLCVLRHAPSSLVWNNVKSANDYESYCYEAITDTQHYVLDILTGTLLLNASPPGRLPRDVLNAPLYTRSFEQRDFEVSIESSTTFKTLQPVDEFFFYEFCVHDEGLVIHEIDKRTGQVFELIDVSKHWFEDLPCRLREMHSHWYCREQRILVMRPILYNNRGIEFIIHDDICHQVPPHGIHRSLQYIVSIPKSSFVIPQSADILNILSKFEQPSYIHTLLHSRNGTGITFHLPRFSITFRTKGSDICSVEHRGFRLAPNQQLKSLPRFRQYLVLEKCQIKDSIERDVSQILLVPDGEVTVNTDGKVKIERSASVDANLQYFVYTVDTRDQTWHANTIPARLQLTAIQTAAGSMLPDTIWRMTGSEMGIETLSRCRVTRVLSDEESFKLNNIGRLAFREPSLLLLCDEIAYEGSLLSFLHPSVESNSQEEEKHREALNASGSELRGHITSRKSCNSLRRWLQPREMKFRSFNPWEPCMSQNNRDTINTLPDCPVALDQVKHLEDKLRSFVKIVKNLCFNSFPIRKVKSSPIESQIVSELRESWEIYQRSGTLEIDRSMNVAIQIHIISLQVDKMYHVMKAYLEETIELVPPSHRALKQLKQAANIYPVICFRDMLRLCFDDSILPQLNPCFSKCARIQYHRATLLFLEICVLHDRIKRIHSHLNDNNAHALVKELSTTRQWDIHEHPRWLVFEVEGRIQIRPEQYIVARHLMDHPGAISQLNMGLGKTRVILPLLLIHLTAEGKFCCPRVHVLSPLLREAIDYLHLHLTASVLSIDIVEQPFQREILLTNERVRILKQMSQRACCQIVAPEHRLSLQLKLHELKLAKHDTFPALSSLFEKEHNFVDIFDESDSILHHSYQLIYAVGAIMPLDHLECRTQVAQALFATINECNLDSALGKLLINPDFCKSSKSYTHDSHDHSYRPVVLSALTDQNAPLRRQFRIALINALIDHPPRELAAQILVQAIP